MGFVEAEMTGLEILIGIVIGILTGVLVWFGPTRITPQLEFGPTMLLDKENRLRMRMRNLGRWPNRNMKDGPERKRFTRWGYVIEARIAVTLRTRQFRLDIPTSSAALMSMPPAGQRVFTLLPNDMNERVIENLRKAGYKPPNEGVNLLNILQGIDKEKRPTLIAQVVATDAFSGTRLYASHEYTYEDIEKGPQFPTDWPRTSPRARIRAAGDIAQRLAEKETAEEQ